MKDYAPSVSTCIIFFIVTIYMKNNVLCCPPPHPPKRNFEVDFAKQTLNYFYKNTVLCR